MIFAIPTDTCYGLGCDIHDEIEYHNLYVLKGRDYSKPCAIVVRDFEDLQLFSDLTAEQIDFLRQYPHPFTILVTTKESFVYPDFIDKTQYAKIAFRIANQCIPAEIRDDLRYPFFLTSANRSGGKELYTPEQVKNVFSDYIESLTIFTYHIQPGVPPSDIFEFIGDSLGLRYLRKCY